MIYSEFYLYSVKKSMVFLQMSDSYKFFVEKGQLGSFAKKKIKTPKQASAIKGFLRSLCHFRLLLRNYGEEDQIFGTLIHQSVCLPLGAIVTLSCGEDLFLAL